jgi:hypothetical protein
MATLFFDDAGLHDANWPLRSTSGLGFFEDDALDISHELNLDFTAEEPVAAPDATEEIREPQSQWLAATPSPAVQQAASADVPLRTETARRARGGGNFSRVARDGMPQRELRIRKNRHGIAMFELTKGNADKILLMIRMIQELRIQPSVAGLCHPCLHITSFSLTAEEYDTLARVLFGYRGTAYIKAFRSFLCYLGMRPAHRDSSEMLTFEFDADGWNRQGYRLCKGGVPARGEGKPRIVFVET